MSILYFFLVLFIVLWILIFWVVTTSFALAWYEYSNRDPELLVDGAPQAGSPMRRISRPAR